MQVLRARRTLTTCLYRLAAPRVGVTKDNQIIVMYHPSIDETPKFDQTRPLPTDRPRTAEEMAHKVLKENKLDHVPMENHYHTRTYPGPDGADVATVSVD